MTTVIKAENISKKYMISHQKKERYQTFSDSLSHLGRQFKNRIMHPFSANAETIEQEEFWALKDINFEIKQGDRVGIIGRNGAGKSTLLKILSRITEPTTGKISIKGRVASLLEVGTGFHPELTGRENIFLNGAILGMTKRDIQARFDEIVAFAEIEKFLDTPVKRYSSGMYVRLAFAVAAHLEPEILIVDEVLAVGDAQFQKKCLGKMKDVGDDGRTVLFVSHNMSIISELCTYGVCITQGGIVKKGDMMSVLSHFLTEFVDNGIGCLKGMKQNGLVIKDFEFCKSGASCSSSFLETGHGGGIAFSFESEISLTSVIISFSIDTLFGERVSFFSSRNCGTANVMSNVIYEYFIELKNVFLLPGEYLLSMKIVSGGTAIFWAPNVLKFSVFGNDEIDAVDLQWSGKCYMPTHWSRTEKGTI